MPFACAIRSPDLRPSIAPNPPLSRTTSPSGPDATSARQGAASPASPPSNSALRRTTVPRKPAGGAQLAVAAERARASAVPEGRDVFDDGLVLVAVGRRTNRRSPAPSRMVIASGCTDTSVTPVAIVSPCATSFGPLGRRKSAYPFCCGSAMMPSSRASPASTASVGALTCAPVSPPWNRLAAMIVAAGSAGAGAGMCTTAGPNNAQPQYAITSANTLAATNVAKAETNLISGCVGCRRYNRARSRPTIASRMNPLLRQLQPYPFERLRAMTADVTPNAAKAPINVSIGEPKHRTPQLILDALARGAATGLANYPTTAGHSALREAIAAWLCRRHRLAALDPATEVLPALGSREALFAFGQTVIDGSRAGATVVVPNPFYQIYEGAALFAGAATYCVNADPV